MQHLEQPRVRVIVGVAHSPDIVQPFSARERGGRQYRSSGRLATNHRGISLCIVFLFIRLRIRIRIRIRISAQLFTTVFTCLQLQTIVIRCYQLVFTLANLNGLVTVWQRVLWSRPERLSEIPHHQK